MLSPGQLVEEDIEYPLIELQAIFSLEGVSLQFIPVFISDQSQSILLNEITLIVLNID